jgi:hypothetical protein
MKATYWMLLAGSVVVLASCQAPPGEYYVGRGGDGEDEADTGRPQELILGRWEPVGGDRKEAVTIVEFQRGGTYRRMDQHRAGWAVTMSADGFGQYEFLDDRTLEIRLRRGKVKVEVTVTRGELVLTYPGKPPERFHRYRAGVGNFGTAAVRFPGASARFRATGRAGGVATQIKKPATAKRP